MVESTRRIDLFGSIAVDIHLKEVNYDNGDNIISTVLLGDKQITTYNNQHIESKRTLRPMISLDKLNIEISFTQPFKQRRLYNFNGMDFQCTLEVTCIERDNKIIPELHTFN